MERYLTALQHVILRASTSRQTAWLPTADKQAPVTRPTSPVPMTGVFLMESCKLKWHASPGKHLQHDMPQTTAAGAETRRTGRSKTWRNPCGWLPRKATQPVTAGNSNAARLVPKPDSRCSVCQRPRRVLRGQPLTLRHSGRDSRLFRRMPATGALQHADVGQSADLPSNHQAFSAHAAFLELVTCCTLNQPGPGRLAGLGMRRWQPG